MSSHDGSVRLWSTSDGALIETFELAKHYAPSVDFDSSWPLTKGYRLALVAPYPKNAIQIHTFKPIARGDDPGVSIESRIELEIKVGYAPASAFFGKQGKRLITWTSTLRRVEIWDAETGEQIALPYQNLRGNIGRPVLAPNGRSFLTPELNFGPVIWPIERRSGFMTLGRGSIVNVGRLSPNGQLLSLTTSEQNITLYDVSTGNALRTLKGHRNFVRSIDFDTNSQRLASSSSDGSIRVWNVSNGKKMARWKPLGAQRFAPLGAVKFSPDGTLLLANLDKGKRFALWGIEQRKLIRYLKQPAESEPVPRKSDYSRQVRRDRMSFSPDGSRIATAYSDGTVSIWDGRDGRALSSLDGHKAPVNSVAFSPDSSYLVTTSDDGTARLWTSNGQTIAILKGHASTVTNAVFDPSGQIIATISTDATARLWSAVSGEHLRTLDGHASPVESIEFSRDGRRLVTSSMDATVRVWNVHSGAEIAELRLDGMLSTRDAQFGPHGKTVLAMSGYDAVLWKDVITTDKPLQDAIDQAKRGVPRCLTQSQRKMFYLPPAPPRWCITGPDLESVQDHTKWRPKWPYQSDEWRHWLAAKDRGEEPDFPVTK